MRHEWTYERRKKLWHLYAHETGQSLVACCGHRFYLEDWYYPMTSGSPKNETQCGKCAQIWHELKAREQKQNHDR